MLRASCSVAVVVSAMSGVTNRLIEAANESKAGNASAVAEVFAQLRKQHDEAVTALIHSTEERRASAEASFTTSLPRVSVFARAPSCCAS